MSIRRVTPEEALRLLQQEGYMYLDVRSIPEFEEGHPEGAFNVPLLQLGCKSGGRSLRAAEQLLHAGFVHVVDQKAGWAGQTDQFGRIAEEGWGPKGLPASKATAPGHGYDVLLKKAYGG